MGDLEMVTMNEAWLFEKIWLYSCKIQYLERVFLNQRLEEFITDGMELVSREVMIKSPEDARHSPAPLAEGIAVRRNCFCSEALTLLEPYWKQEKSLACLPPIYICLFYSPADTMGSRNKRTD
jgi:hypothetical protein